MARTFVQLTLTEAERAKLQAQATAAKTSLTAYVDGLIREALRLGITVPAIRVSGRQPKRGSDRLPPESPRPAQTAPAPADPKQPARPSGVGGKVAAVWASHKPRAVDW